tara:strand:+ start:2824 stop:2967 length:144 start_codon:yes stop_codon:yes gene_type:complete
MDKDVSSVYKMTIERLKIDNKKLRNENDRLFRILKHFKAFFTISKFK